MLAVTALLQSGANLDGAEVGTPQIIRAAPTSFNPTAQQQTSIAVLIPRAGNLTVQVLDRDGFLVRTLAEGAGVRPGTLMYAWDGRNSQGDIVPDEAYSFRIELESDQRVRVYCPASQPARTLPVKLKYYDRRSAILSYELPTASRVHIQAGTARPGDGAQTSGPVLRTIVNREPRAAGAVVETWDGLDEGRTFYVPNLPDFAIAIAATSLPEHAVISYGNRATSFLAYANARRGGPLVRAPVARHDHHAGLTTLEDVAPVLNITPLNAAWLPRERIWQSHASTLRLDVALQGPSTPYFVRQPTKLYIFVGREMVQAIPEPGASLTIQVPLSRPGVHILALNWASAYGPVAVNTFKIRHSRASGGGKAGTP